MIASVAEWCIAVQMMSPCIYLVRLWGSLFASGSVCESIDFYESMVLCVSGLVGICRSLCEAMGLCVSMVLYVNL